VFVLAVGFVRCVWLLRAQTDAARDNACRLAKFQGVNTLTVFVSSNQGDKETTRVTKLLMSGTTVQGMNVADIKKSEED
jgi:PITH domain